MKLYLAAFGVVATILSLKLTLPDGFLTLDTPLLLLIVTVAICSWRSGVRIGAFTTLICSVIAIFAFWQEGGPNTDLRLALFVVLGVLIGVMAETVRADQIRNDKEKSDLEDQVRKEQRKIEMLEANERYFRDTADCVPLFIWMSGTDKGCVYVNRSWLEFTGRNFEQEVGQGWVENIHPDDRQRTVEKYGTAFDARRDFRDEFRIQGANGEYHWILAQGTPHFTEGDFVGYIGSAVDISPRKQYEVQMTASEKRKAAILETSLDGIITIDATGTILEFNPAAEHIFGYTQAEAIGQPMAELLIPDKMRQKHLDGFAKCCETGISDMLNRRIETWGKRKDGSEFPAELALARIENHHHCVFTAFVRDITERKKHEDDVKEAARRKDEFLAVLAHELRNPLSPIRNGVRILKVLVGAKGSKANEILEMMERQVDQLVRLVDDLLDVSRITRGKIEMKKEIITIGSAIERAVESTGSVVACCEHELTVHLPDDTLYVEADPARLSQVFQNLLTNACKYTNPGGQISVMAEREGNEAVIRVRDTGIGLPPEELQSIFDMFVQVDSSVERSQGGLGIGLTLVKSFLDMHGGTITAESEGKDKGSTFTVRLPLTDKRPQEKRPQDDFFRVEPTGKRILVVDDNQDAAKSLATLLKMGGHEVKVATSGEDALCLAREFQPQIMIQDIGMPGMSGYDVAKHIRSAPETEGIILVALTGYGQQFDKGRSKEAGFNFHLVKPLDIKSLQEILSNPEGATMGVLT